jgi:hypothetical protein
VSQTAYPTESDLRTRLLSFSPVTAAFLAPINLADKIARARRDMEQNTGRVFLAVTSARTYTPRTSGPFLDLRADLAEFTSLSISGTPKTLNTDFELWPENADADGRPWTMIRFTNYFNLDLLSRRTVVVTGKWGYSVAIPDDVWDAILDRGVDLCAPEISGAISGGLTSEQHGDEKWVYGNGALSAEFTRAGASFQSVVSTYKRVAQG